MKSKNVMVVAIIIIALILVVIIGVNMKGKNNGTSQIGTSSQGEEYFEIKPDGTKVNTSNELSKTKKIDGLEISNIQLVENSNLSKITADVKNPTKKTLGDYEVSIIMLDKAGKEIATVGGYIDKVEAGETAKLKASATVDIANAYDFKVVKK